MHRPYSRKENELTTKIGISPIINALATRYPDLPPAKLEQAAESILKEVEDGLSSGRQIGFLKLNDDGSVEIDLLKIVMQAGR